MKIPPEKLDPRMAGEVARYHTEVTLRPQSVASHSWNVARILLAVWPETPRHLLVEALMHDVGEVFAGDSPSPAKWAHPPLKLAVDEVEDTTRLAMVLGWGVPPHSCLTLFEDAVLKLVDLMEAWEYCLCEVSCGNRHARVLVSRCEETLREATTGLPNPDEYNVGRRATAYMKRRLVEEERR